MTRKSLPRVLDDVSDFVQILCSLISENSLKFNKDVELFTCSHFRKRLIPVLWYSKCLFVLTYSLPSFERLRLISVH